MSNTRRKFLFWIATITVCVVADRFLKSYALHHWAFAPSGTVFGFGFAFLLNPGIAFSISFGGTPLLAVTSVVLSLFCWQLWRAVRERNVRAILACLTVLISASSNIADRFLYGGVVDYLALGPLSVINLADVMILTGIVTFIIGKREKGRG